MRVLLVSSYPPRPCGIGAYARDQAARLRAEGHEVTVLSPPDGGGSMTVKFFGGRPFFRAARLSRRFDRVIVHFQPALYFRPRAPVSKVLSSLGLLSLALSCRRLEILVHEADPPVRWRPDYFLLRLAFRTAPRLLFHTEAERATFEAAYRIRPRAVLLPHRVSPGPPVSRRDARERLGLGAVAEPVFLCAGFLQPSKGFDRAIRAFAGAGGGSLWIIGSVRDETPENLAHARDLERLCRATSGASMRQGFADEGAFDLWMSAADWLVLPYRRAWSSGVLARAQALGIPAIVMATGGLAEQAGPGDHVVRSDEELAAALRDRVAGSVPARGGSAK